LRRGWIIGIIGMSVIIVSVGGLSYGYYLTETYIGDSEGPIMPDVPPNYNPDLDSRGELLVMISPYFLFLGVVILAIGIHALLHESRAPHNPEEMLPST
jgi:hypothetical protein